MATSETENNALQSKSTPQIKKSGGSEKYVLGALMLGFVSLLVYQFFFYPTCYGCRHAASRQKCPASCMRFRFCRQASERLTLRSRMSGVSFALCLSHDPEKDYCGNANTYNALLPGVVSASGVRPTCSAAT